jgi:hypothetical protein
MPTSSNPRKQSFGVLAMSELHIIIDSDAASDSWGFVGVVRIGQVEAYPPLRPSPLPSWPPPPCSG